VQNNPEVEEFFNLHEFFVFGCAGVYLPETGYYVSPFVWQVGQFPIKYAVLVRSYCQVYW